MISTTYSLSDYLLFAILLGACISLFAFAACKGSSNFNDYVWGGERLTLAPVTLSLIATQVNSITFMFAGELYQYGISVCYEIVAVMLNGIIIWLQIGKLHKLKLISLNDYFQMRFCRSVKLLVIPLIYCGQIIHTMVGAFTTSVFMGQVFGVHDLTCFFIVILLCFLLTALGGFNAVIWTDSCFAIAMAVSCTALAAIGVDKVGGFENIWNSAFKGDRLSTEWALDPTIRVSAWSMGLGSVGTWFAMGTMFNSTIYQRYSALTEKQAKKAILFHIAAPIGFKCFSYLSGLIIYCLYQGCDPVLSGEIHNYDQLLGYFVLQVGKSSKMFVSLFVMCNVSASLSTITTIMGTFSVTFYKDIFQAKFNPSNEDARGKRLVQLSGLIMVGAVIILMAMIYDSGTILDLASFAHFPLCVYASVLFLGIFIPRIRSKDVLWGAGAGTAVLVWMVVGSRIAYKKGLILNEVKPMKIDQCPDNVTLSVLEPRHGTGNVDPPFYLYRISPYYQNLLGFIVCVSVASISSFFYGQRNSPAKETRKTYQDKLEGVPLSEVVRNEN